MSTSRVALGTTGLDVHPLCFGGNVFGWSADERGSFALLDAYLEAGGNFIDTADAYAHWAPGNRGGESETILGKWMTARRCRDRVVIATKAGKMPGLEGLAPKTIRAAVEGSLKRLGTDRIDLYYAHADDAKTPLEESVRAFDALVKAGKVRALGVCNFKAPRLAEALAIATREKLARFAVVQDHYNLMERSVYEGELAALCRRESLAFLPYYALAKGFLAGKYRPGRSVESVRAQAAGAYLDARGKRVLAELDSISAARRTTVAAVALAWLRAQPGVVTPIASARTPEQLAELLPMATLDLTGEEVTRLGAASSTSAANAG